MTTKYGVHATQISRWKQVALDCIKNSFINNKTEKFSQDENKIVSELYSKIGQLSCENDFLKKGLWK